MLAAAMPFFGVITFAACSLQIAGWTNITEAVKSRTLPKSVHFINRPLLEYRISSPPPVIYVKKVKISIFINLP
jgi:hypothetical protein